MRIFQGFLHSILSTTGSNVYDTHGNIWSFSALRLLNLNNKKKSLMQVKRNMFILLCPPCAWVPEHRVPWGTNGKACSNWQWVFSSYTQFRVNAMLQQQSAVPQVLASEGCYSLPIFSYWAILFADCEHGSSVVQCVWMQDGHGMSSCPGSQIIRTAGSL